MIHERMWESMKNISVKEFGATNLLLEMIENIKDRVKKIYSKSWKEIVVFSIFRLLYNSPMKNY